MATTKTFSGITNWGDAAAEVTVVVELTDGEVTSMGAIIHGTYDGIAVTGEATLEPVIE